jgi:hypothetical protein
MGRIMSRAGAAVLALGAALSAGSAIASADYYLEIKGTKGESRTVEVQSFSWGATNSGAVRRETSPPEHHGVLQVVTAREAGSGMATGRAACAAGTHLPQATLRGPGGTWELHGVEITGCPAQGITLSYAHVQSTGRAVKTRSNIQNN